jgi:hypothetical protein
MRHLLALLLACTTLCARADIIYDWVGNNDATPFNISMRLVFTDHAFDDGVVELTMRPVTGRPQPARPDSELLELRYTTPGLSGTIDYSPATVGLRTYEELRLHFTMDAAGALSGSLYANNSQLHVGMAGFDDLFTVTTANSDYGMYAAGCENFIDCKGATGRFLRQQGGFGQDPDQPLPEPMTLGLTALGLFGMGYSRRHAAARISAATARSVA